MERKPDPQRSRSTSNPSTDNEAIPKVYTFTAFETLTFILLPVSFTLALASSPFILADGKMLKDVPILLIWPISAYINGLIPLAIYSSIYARLHNRRVMTYGRCLLLSFLVIAGVSSVFVPFGLLPITLFYCAVGFLHAAPTVLLCHLKLSSPGHKWPKHLLPALMRRS